MLLADLKHPRWILCKGILFLLLSAISVTWIVLLTSSFHIAALLVIAIWSSCRFYYFAFYVMERYVDGQFRYRGLLDLTRHVLLRHVSVGRAESRDS